MKNTPVIKGKVDPKFENVHSVFRKHFEENKETYAQLCIYVRGRKVVDLWGSKNTSNHFNGDSITNVFSSTKNLTSLAVAMLVDRGHLKYEDKISQHWQAFGQNGKEDITLADLMRHEAGLTMFDHEFDPEDFWPTNIKRNNVGIVIEKKKPYWPKTGKREYHGLTRGWIANEVFRRVHPDGLTIGEFLTEEVAKPLQCNGVVLGAHNEDLKRYQALHHIEYDGVNGRRKAMINCSGGENGEIWNNIEMRKGETPSANGNCSARGLAKVGAVLAGKGCFGNVNLLSESGWRVLHDGITEETMLGKQTFFSQGGIAKLDSGYFGWVGYGGSCFQWNPELQISFAYVPCLLIPSANLADDGERGEGLKIALMESMKKPIENRGL